MIPNRIEEVDRMSNFYTYKYECNELPTLTNPVWTKIINGTTISEEIIDETLHISSVAGLSVNNLTYQINEQIIDGGIFICEFKLKWIGIGGGGNNILYLYLRNLGLTQNLAVYFYKSVGSILVNLTGNGNTFYTLVDDSGYHIYKLRYNTITQKVELFIDGVLRCELSEQISYTGGNNYIKIYYTANYVNNQNDIYFDYIYMNETIKHSAEPTHIAEPNRV